jgi:N-methylhydantoinase A/oxoprolinase/acetone carboxylase beta subunit
VLVDGANIVAAVKTPTTADVTTGILTALSGIVRQSLADPESLEAVMIGTTHFTNAVAQRRNLSRVAAVRICLPASRSLEPFVDWPDDLREKAAGDIIMLEGGHEYDGRPIVPFDEEGMRRAARRIRDKGLTAVGITSVFSPLTPELEERAREILYQEHPQATVTLSHEIGRIGLLERENATLLNASLLDLAKRTTRAFRRAIEQSGLAATLYLTQNDGTVTLAEIAVQFPIFSFASGPTNSMRGGAFLSHLSDAIVIDVGGTTTDVGILVKGFPREANNVIKVGGVRTLFRMPDVLSLALGGGTLVRRDPLAIGPQSTGYELMQRGLVFGGTDLTCTDIAVAGGLVALGDHARVAHLPAALVADAIREIQRIIEDAVDRIKTEAGDVPVIAVGGGAFLIPAHMKGVSEVLRIPHGNVANAVGAAIAQVSGECDQIFRDMSRDQMIDMAKRIASEHAIESGANAQTLEVVDVEDLPLAYMPGNSVRARVRVVGDIA